MQLAQKRGRPYLDELDRLRIITALSVVAVHVLALTAFLDATPLALLIQNGFVTAFHFTREVFMFVTAFALVYVYYGKPFSTRTFWKKRGIGVVFPYVVWSIIYLWVNLHPASPLDFLQALFWALLRGNASYQLYYILLTIQFYILFPLFLLFLRRAGRHPWVTLGVSFALEVATLYVIYHYVQAAPLSGTIGSILNQYTDSFVLVYQFYFVLGAMAALYLREIRDFLLRHGAWIVGGAVVALVALELHYVISLQIAHVSLDRAVAVLQPVMAFYSLAVIAFLYWFAYRRVVRLKQINSSRSQVIWRTLSNASFGIYLVHPLFLTFFLGHMSALSSWPVVLPVALAWLFTAGGATLFSVLLLHVPILSRLIGRERPLPRALAGLGQKIVIQPVVQLSQQWSARVRQLSLFWRAEPATEPMLHKPEKPARLSTAHTHTDLRQHEESMP